MRPAPRCSKREEREQLTGATRFGTNLFSSLGGPIMNVDSEAIRLDINRKPILKSSLGTSRCYRSVVRPQQDASQRPELNRRVADSRLVIAVSYASDMQHRASSGTP